MEHISIDKSLDLFLTTLGYLDERFIKGSDDDIDYYILTELDSDAHTFMHNYTVGLLFEAQLIPESIIKDTERLRADIKDLIKRKITYNEIRYDLEWCAARKLAKSILTKIKTHQDKN